MELSDLGYDQWFERRFTESADEACIAARVAAVHRDGFVVWSRDGTFPAELTGRLRFTTESAAELPCTGDWVSVQPENDGTFGIIHTVLERRTFLRRKTPGKDVDFQMIAANVDVAFIVQACEFDFNLRRLERYLVMVREGGVTPIILLSKSDLADPEELSRRIDDVRTVDPASDVVVFSNKTGYGIADVRARLGRAETCCLLGSSGVGKTSLLNTLVGTETFETAAVREKDGRGRHTTSRRELVVLDNGALIIDTPGMRELANIGATAGVEESFAEIRTLASSCRFSDCTHTTEAGCAVLAALESGEVSLDRYESYMKLGRESAYYESSYVERRRKDKAQGKFYREVLRHHRKKKGI